VGITLVKQEHRIPVYGLLELVFDGEFARPFAAGGIASIFTLATARVAWVVGFFHEIHLKKWRLDLLRDAFSSESFADTRFAAKEDDESTA